MGPGASDKPGELQLSATSTGRLRVEGSGDSTLQTDLLSHRSDLGLPPRLDLALWTQVAMAAVLAIVATLWPPEPSTRPAIPDAMLLRSGGDFGLPHLQWHHSGLQHRHARLRGWCE